MLLIAYDGSQSARAAIDQAGTLLGRTGTDALVLTTWEPYQDTLTRSGAATLGGAASMPTADLDEQVSRHALETATEGAELATAVGLRAAPRAEPTTGSPATTILEVADEIEAEAIVLGSRGHGRVASLLLGSTSHHVLHHAHRPVIVVPSDCVAGEKAARAGDTSRATPPTPARAA
ncbi:MAG: universal stress protein [Solirubrobacteraceae bacterium]|nr:universal stress protein [Solirubrobacteraceae bacterium]